MVFLESAHLARCEFRLKLNFKPSQEPRRVSYLNFLVARLEEAYRLVKRPRAGWSITLNSRNVLRRWVIYFNKPERSFFSGNEVSRLLLPDQVRINEEIESSFFIIRHRVNSQVEHGGNAFRRYLRNRSLEKGISELENFAQRHREAFEQN